MSKILFSLFPIFYFIASLTLSANNNVSDSLIQIVNNAGSKERLELLDKYTRSFPTEVKLIDELERESIIQSDYLYLASAYKSKVYYYTRIGNQDSTRLYLNKVDEALKLFDNNRRNKISKDEKTRYDSIIKLLYTTRTALYLHEGKYDLALFEIDKVLNNPKVDKTDDFENQLYTLSGMAYLYTQKYEKAIASLREAYKLVEKTSNESNLGKYSYHMALKEIGSAYGGLNRYEDAVLITDTLLYKIREEHLEYQKIHGLNPEEEFIYNYFKSEATVNAALWSIKTNRLQKARIELDSVQLFVKENLGNNTQHTDFEVYYIVEGEYYLKTKQYDIAERYIRTLIDRLSIQEQFLLYNMANDLLARILDVQGKNKEAYLLIANLKQINDSINTTNFSNQFAEMNILYEVDKSKAQAEQKKAELRSTQVILLVTLLAFILSLIILFLIYRNRKKLVEKNKSLYSQYKLIEESNKKIKELQNIQETLIEKDVIDSDPYHIIMRNLEKYLEESKVYIDSEIDREGVALKIGTNRQYLIEAIKQNTGKTFNEYIYSYRLKYAYDLILNCKEKTISEILEESGFSTRATFYKAFKDTYGLTPSELRNIFK